ncbi:MAG: hypothetical protein IH600_01465, partial [Bacteroidetes bacterium]|nr:hypothetical protein [Bacteroidota bacterium]
MQNFRLHMTALMLIFLSCASVAFSQHPVSDFKQAANNYSSYGLGDVYWLQSILQKHNSVYYEGMSVPQRLMLASIPATSGNQHTLVFSHRATKGGKHAYDYLTSYAQALTASAAIAGPTTLVNLNVCGSTLGPPSSLAATCASLHAGSNSILVDIPDAMGSTLSHNIATSIANYETRFGNRTVQLFGNAPITAATLTFNGYSKGKDVLAEYTLTWTSASSSVLLEFAGHLAMGDDVLNAGMGIGYGSGYGAGSISGAPFHFKLDRLDRFSLGSQDNQIMGSSILTKISCAVSGPDPVCVNTQNTYGFITSANLSYSWSLSANSSGATIAGSSHGQSVVVNAGTQGGTYTLTATVSDGSQTVVCNYPVTVQGLTVSANASVIHCAGGTSTVTVTAHGGKAPYHGTGTFSRGGGNHTFTVTDAEGCAGITSVAIPEPPPCTIAAVATPILCNGGTSTITVTASGGTPPYAGTGTFSAMAGTHTFVITDALNCAASTTVTLTEPPLLSASSTATPLSCTGGGATVTVTAAGGIPPYSGTGTFSAQAGTHTYTVTDANNCTATTSVTISGASQLNASASATPILCNGSNSTVTVTATGGTPPYTGIGTFSVAAGTHAFTVSDANNCSATTSVTVTAPPQLAATASATPILCGGSTSTVTVTATGGTPPYTGTGTFSRAAGSYSFTVTDANSCSATATVTIAGGSAVMVSANATPILCNGTTSAVTVIATGGTPPYTGTGTFTLPAGTHNFTVTDANNCSGTTSVTITQPPTLSVSSSATPILCYGTTSAVTVTASGGTPPYTGAGTFSYPAGTHTITVTDANNCTATTTVTITAPPQLAAAASATPILCGGSTSTVTVTASGGTPPYTGTGTFSRTAGSYSFTVTDANSCSATATVTISGGSAVMVSANATPILCNGTTSAVTVITTGGTPPYTGTGTFNLPAGMHNFTVTDANNCSGTTSVT